MIAPSGRRPSGGPPLASGGVSILASLGRRHGRRLVVASPLPRCGRCGTLKEDLVKIDFTPDPALYPFKPHWFDSSAGQMHYIDEGTGPPILFCHGNPTWSFLYRNIITALRGRFRC